VGGAVSSAPKGDWKMGSLQLGSESLMLSFVHHCSSKQAGAVCVGGGAGSVTTRASLARVLRARPPSGDLCVSDVLRHDRKFSDGSFLVATAGAAHHVECVLSNVKMSQPSGGSATRQSGAWIVSPLNVGVGVRIVIVLASG
jgi:hypothetical protein